MQARLITAALLPSLFLVACGGGSNSPRAVEAPGANNNNGSPVTAIITAKFDPSNGVVPFPTNLLLSGTTDLTLNIPVADPTNFGDPKVAMNALDGFSTVAPWSTTFSTPPRPSTLAAGTTVRVFQVTLSGPGGGVTGLTRELAPNAEYVVALASSDSTGRTMAIVPTKPLQQLSSYLVVLTNGITDNAGNDATPDQTYFLAKRTSPLCINGVSQEPLLPADQLAGRRRSRCRNPIEQDRPDLGCHDPSHYARHGCRAGTNCPDTSDRAPDRADRHESIPDQSGPAADRRRLCGRDRSAVLPRGPKCNGTDRALGWFLACGTWRVRSAVRRHA